MRAALAYQFGKRYRCHVDRTHPRVGATIYKSSKETSARPGEWIAISGIGDLGHLAVQYAKAMGLDVAAIDVSPEELALARNMGADIDVEARSEESRADPLGNGRRRARVLVTVVSPPAFNRLIKMARCRAL